MGFYFRKSVRAGPFRFNLSKSGVGISTGVRGFRIGTGPHGNYVHMGVGGFYYRKTLPPFGASQPTQATRVSGCTPAVQQPAIGMAVLNSADAVSMCAASSKELLAEINEKRTRWSVLPILLIMSALAAMILVGIAAQIGGLAWLLILLLLPVPALVILAHYWDQNRKAVVLLYDLAPSVEQAFRALHDHAEVLRRCAASWYEESSTTAHDRRYHAGASQLLTRQSLRLSYGNPAWIKTNVDAVVLFVGRQRLYFLPDKILVYDPSGVGAIEYAELLLEVRQSQFIESGSVPSDSKVVGTTWRYVNKDGSPDRRFANNSQIPICLYDEMKMHSVSGLNQLLQFSKIGAAMPFCSSLRTLQHIIAALPQTTAHRFSNP